jgi:hypothetical protein
MIITAAQVVRAMIPAMRERSKKIAAIHATRNEIQPAASMVSFRIVIQVVVSVVGIFRQLRAGLASPCTARGCCLMAQVPLASPTLSTLLYRVQLLVEQHPQEHQQKYPRPDAEHAHRDGKPVDLC